MKNKKRNRCEWEKLKELVRTLTGDMPRKAFKMPQFVIFAFPLF